MGPGKPTSRRPLILGALSAFLLAFGISFSASALIVDRDLPGIQEDLKLLSQTELEKASSLHELFFGPDPSGMAHIQFITDRAERISLNPLFCMGGMAAACVDESKFPARIFVSHPEFDTLKSVPELVAEIYQVDFSDDVSSHWISRASLLIHEARHLSALHQDHGRRFSQKVGHSTCQKSKDSRPTDCDLTAEGAYGFQIVFLLNMAKHCVKGCTDEDRSHALRFAEKLKSKVDQKTWDLIQLDLAKP